MYDYNETKQEEKKVDSVSAFYSDVSHTEETLKDKVLKNIGIIVIGMALGIVSYFTANAIGGSIGLMVWGLTSNGLVYFLVYYGLIIGIFVVMIYFFQRMVKSWTGSNQKRNVFMISCISPFVILFIYAMLT